jgi:drug/metabolite transporter (DMT)-like permease
MDNRWVVMVLFVCCVLVSSCSHILLKRAANRDYKGIKMFLNKETITGYSIFFGVTLGVALLYRRIDLSTGALLESFSYIFIPVLGWLFFKEKLNKRQWIGVTFIITGIIVYVLLG